MSDTNTDNIKRTDKKKKKKGRKVKDASLENNLEKLAESLKIADDTLMNDNNNTEETPINY